MNKHLVLFFFISLLFSFCKEKETVSPLDATQQDVVNELNTVSTPVAGSEIALPANDLAPLDAFANAKIIGLGEATHGTKEFFQMKHRIFKYMVEQHGFKAIAFEMDVAESMIFEDLIQGKTNGDMRTAMINNMYFWTWTTQEVKELLIWMRDYNVGKSANDRIHFYGIDCQTTRYNANTLVSLLAKVNLGFANDVQTQLQGYLALNEAGDSTNNLKINQKISDVSQQLIDRKDDLIANGLSASDFETAKHLVRVMIQTQTLIYLLKVNPNLGSRYRDLFMAENAGWISTVPQNGNKICLWAHNGHICNDNSYQSMGYQLNHAFPGQYKKIGFAFGGGKFTAYASPKLNVYSIDTDPPKSSTNFLMRYAKGDNLLLRLDQLDSGTPLANWMNTKHDFLLIGGVYDGTPTHYYYAQALRDLYDVIIYFDITKNSEHL